ncbi:MAG: hypothetical protein ACD_30C00104G0002 [uncultured bacterium]|uniref:Uncharacterized protein n=3 Tax=Candidatus Daviesiibacteriota TaxID=1752718 RepID=A0A0G0F549_9BACT|nr:MAG: hypothetical protein ACD_30C00104G0002 [uncultured bacterium]KKQ08585.1 MAG: hypothetical protein US19_C0021G0001 [Candidatus Daviesbacteria bacterium GW2011_GWB1_36_5]KKQ16264.1 MAG: hypothetical protein US28_C0003G0028 [Candidatus Daviesbacteria bacterium GW2011_GWA1_36_8]OGE33133.1 MAG: hypothetical protein A3C99_03850 [Candidatus Daviesbacteria bacterium RIFCSPHIGHO2_02_FULL_37_9]OGE36731.1 MAG: hypothetical protein A3E66_02250 [Candidatus Daviesbacteria bacterium RIFCSPHIGHO2_12_FU
MLVLIAGYFLDEILTTAAKTIVGGDSFAGLDFLLFGIMVAIILINRKKIIDFLKGKNING